MNHQIGDLLTRANRYTGRLVLLSMLALSLGSCNAIGGAFSSVGSSVRGAVFPGGDQANNGQSTNVAQAATQGSADTDERAPLGSGSADERIARLEQEVTSLRQELAQLKPSIERLVGIEGDIRILLTQLSRLTDSGATPTDPPATAEGAAAQPATAAPVATPPAATAAPPALRPVEQAQGAAPVGQPQSLRPIQAPAAAQPAPAAPTQLTSISPTVAPGEQVSVHLASFRQQESARQGWRELQAANSDLLGGLDYRISAVQLTGGRGTFYRVKAGPFTDTSSA
ncbi:MAG: SPOR domain-containing protein, partial [Alphaproteobacteria bacterium]|nr:SPOR domain-containing protein [Alphaproteobacteria bacterium]